MGGFVTLTNKASGKTEVVDSDDLPTALASGRYVDPGAVAVHSDGLDTYVDSSVARQDKAFTPTIDPARAQTAAGHRIREQANTGLAAGARAGLGGFASGLSAGLVSPFEDEQEFNPGVAFAGQALGVIAPALVGDEAGLLGLARYTPAGAIGRVGAGVGERLGGGLLARGAAGAAEGSLYGVAQGVGETLRSDDPLAWEHAASAISSNALFGGALGGGLGIAGAAVERGLASGRAAIESRLAGVHADGGILAAAPDVMAMDGKALRLAREQEVESLRAAQQPDREAFTRQLSDHLNETEGDELWKYTKKEADREARKLGKTSLKADFKVRDVLDNEQALMRNPAKALDGLERQEQTLAEVKELAERNLTKWSLEVDQAPNAIRKDIIDGKVKGFVVGPGGLSPTSPLIDQEVERIMTAKYGPETTRMRLDSTGATGIQVNVAGSPHFDAVMDASKALDRVRDLKTSIAKLTAEPTSERLAAIDAAKTALDTPHAPSLGERILHHIPGGGLVGELAGIGQKATGGLRKAVAAGAQQTGKAVAAFLGGAEKLTAPAATAATKVLSSVRFGTGPEPKSDELHDLYAARTTELRQQTAMAPDGSIQMTAAARAELHQKLTPVAAADPVGADRIETALARRTAYMSSKIPKRPEVGGIQVGPDNWRPSDLQMRSWARTVRACEDPHGVEVRLASGTVTPEDAEAYRTCYPERFRALQQTLFAAVPTLPKTLPTARKVALFTFTGVPTMPALQPNVLKVLQASFAMEAGSRGGSAAPVPMPSFGALGSAKTMDQPTPAQKRGG